MGSNSSSAIIAASRARWVAPLAAVLTVACAPVEVPRVGAAPAEPEVRVALGVADPGVEIGGGDALVLTDERGGSVLDLPAGRVARAVGMGDRVLLRLQGVASVGASRLDVAPADSGGNVRVRGRDYRGRVTLTSTGAGLLIVNRLGIESYLAGVVSSELGRRQPGEEAALEAQAIASRTFALKALGRFRTEGYDLLGTVSDQVYGGVGSETVLSRAAVAATRGSILTWQGQPIDVFFHSTCAGRTAAAEEVFANGARPYLRSAPDVDPGGRAWCAISPRYRWTARWTRDQLLAVLRTTLPALGREAGSLAELRDVVVTGHSPSGRVSALELRTRGGSIALSGAPVIRQAFRPADAPLLRSAAFRVITTRASGRLTALTLEGQGAGHGVGLCQWGAVGRARAGQSVAAILSWYFPGTAVERRW